MASLGVSRAFGLLIAGLVGAGAGYGVALMGWGPIKEDQDHVIALLDEQRRALDAAVVDQARAVEALGVAQTTLITERDRREGERLVELATRQGLQSTVHTRDSELASVRAQLAFYEQLLPSGPPGTVAIRGFTVSATPQVLRYRVLLMRSGRPSGDAFVGRLQFVAEGVQDGEAHTVNLEPLVVSEQDANRLNEMKSGDAATDDKAPAVEDGRGDGFAQADGGQAAKGPLLEKDGQTPARPAADNTFAVEFVQYQRSQGLLALPKNFELRSVTLNVLEGNVVRATRRTEP